MARRAPTVRFIDDLDGSDASGTFDSRSKGVGTGSTVGSERGQAA